MISKPPASMEPVRRTGIVVIVSLLLAGLWWTTRLGGLSDEDKAQRLLYWSGFVCTPKIVTRPEEGVLAVVCADGKHEFIAEPSCDESFACSWGIDVACWDHQVPR